MPGSDDFHAAHGCLPADAGRGAWRRYMGSGQKAAVVDAYVEVRAGAEVFRTPCVHASPSPAWNWDFDIRLPAPSPSPAALDVITCPFRPPPLPPPVFLLHCP